MKHYYIFLLILPIIVSAQGAGSNSCNIGIVLGKPADFDYTDSPYEWKLLFDDNFDGNALDKQKWDNSYSWCARSLGTGEAQYYTDDENFIFSGGTLKIIARNEQVSKLINLCSSNVMMPDGLMNQRTFNYTSGLISTKTNFSYGKYEIRCKIPYASGSWPAFWTFGDSPTGQTEIDCFEFYGGNYNQQGTNLHTNNSTSCGMDIYGTGFTSSFHVYSFIYTPSYVEWYTDGILIRKVNKYRKLSRAEAYIIVSAWSNDPDQEDLNDYYQINQAFPHPDSWMRIIANYAVENTAWPLTFPGTFEIDYIKYYQRRPCSSSVTNMSAPTLYTTLNNYTTYHSITGNDLNISNTTINNNQQLQLGACNTISILSEFEAVQGANFIAETDSKYCCTPDAGFRLQTDEDTDENYSTLMNMNSVVDSNILDPIQSKVSDNITISEKNKLLSNKNFKVYPSPSNGQFIVETSNENEKQLNIVNNLGFIIYTDKFRSKNYNLNLNLASGIYLVQIINNGIKNEQKIIIKN